MQGQRWRCPQGAGRTPRTVCHTKLSPSLHSYRMRHGEARAADKSWLGAPAGVCVHSPALLPRPPQRDRACQAPQIVCYGQGNASSSGGACARAPGARKQALAFPSHPPTTQLSACSRARSFQPVQVISMMWCCLVDSWPLQTIQVSCKPLRRCVLRLAPPGESSTQHTTVRQFRVGSRWLPGQPPCAAPPVIQVASSVLQKRRHGTELLRAHTARSKPPLHHPPCPLSPITKNRREFT